MKVLVSGAGRGAGGGEGLSPACWEAGRGAGRVGGRRGREDTQACQVGDVGGMWDGWAVRNDSRAVVKGRRWKGLNKPPGGAAREVTLCWVRADLYFP